MNQNFRKELNSLLNKIKTLDRKIVVIFLSVAVLQTISWYYCSQKFFGEQFSDKLLIDEATFQFYEYLYWFFTDFVVLFIIPILIIRILFKERLSEYGLRIGDWKTGLTISIFFLVIMSVIIWFVSSFDSFASKYPLLEQVKNNLAVFIIYESALLIYMFAWEFIWRGFMLFGLYAKFGYYAVLIQMIPFVILHNGKPVLETFGAILGGIALGILALRTRSIIYCVIVHFGVMFGIDLISALRLNADEYEIGLNALYNIFSSIF